MGAIAASAAVHITTLPWKGSVGVINIGLKDDKYIVNPTNEELDSSPLNLVVSSTKEAVLMIEVGANEVSEKVIIDGVKLAFDEAQKIALANQKNAFYLESIDSFSEADLSDGALELLSELKRRGFLIGLASASNNAPQLLKAMAIEHFFDAIVDPKSIDEGKPAPDIFIKAAELLKMKPEHCIGIEDAYAGIESIKAAGMTAYGIGSKEVLTNCDHVFHNLIELKSAITI